VARGRPQTRLEPNVRRAQIVDAATRALEGHDPSEVSFETIADEAGVSRALVYKHFGDRGGLLAAVYVRSVERLGEEIREAVDGVTDPACLVRASVGCYLRFARSNAAAWRLLHLAGTMQHPAVQAARRDGMERLAALAGGSSEARIVAYGVVGLLESATLDWLDTEDVDRAGLAEVLADLLWKGLSSLPRHGITLPL
jgi:AcrR family transcriptional regulator